MFWLNLAMFFFSQMQAVEVHDDVHAMLPPPTPCPAQPCPSPFFAPMPVGMPMPAPMKAYRVEVRFTGGPKNELPPVKTAALVREKMPPAATSVSWHAGGQARCATVSSSVKSAHEGRVELDLGLVCSGAKECRCQAVETVHLNTKTNVVFKGDCPEPCCAEVTVVEVTEPMPPLALTSCPAPYMPCPTSPITQCSGAAQVCCPPQVVSPAPVYHGLIMPPTFPAAPAWCPLPAPVQVCSATAAARPMRTSHLSIVRDGEKSRVKMTCGESCVTSTRMTIEGGEAGTLTIAASGTCVRVTGKTWKAQADSIDVRDDGTVRLRGQVKLTSDRIGAGASVKATELCVKVTRGTFEKIVSKGVQPTVPAQQTIDYATPVSAPMPAR